MLIEMRHAPDARLLLEVALVKLTKQSTGDDFSGLLARIERLEAGVVKEPTNPVVRPAPVNPATGRAQLGGKAAAKPSTPRTVAAPAEPLSDAQVVAKWPDVVGGLKPLVRALYSAISPVECVENVLTLEAPNEMHLKKADEHRETVESMLAIVSGRKLDITFALAAPKDPTSPTSRTKRPAVDNEVDDVVDPQDIIDSRPVTMPSVVDQLTKAFPGSHVVDQPKKS
jgi:DNA polymerase-3 subunit gamma/tau